MTDHGDAGWARVFGRVRSLVRGEAPEVRTSGPETRFVIVNDSQAECLVYALRARVDARMAYLAAEGVDSTADELLLRLVVRLHLVEDLAVWILDPDGCTLVDELIADVVAAIEVGGMSARELALLFDRVAELDALLSRASGA